MPWVLKKVKVDGDNNAILVDAGKDSTPSGSEAGRRCRFMRFMRRLALAAHPPSGVAVKPPPLMDGFPFAVYSSILDR